MELGMGKIWAKGQEKYRKVWRMICKRYVDIEGQGMEGCTKNKLSLILCH
jgi:hypothetical protein